jgi:hypothetical protein
VCEDKRSEDLLRLLSGLRGCFLRFLADIFALRAELLFSMAIGWFYGQMAMLQSCKIMMQARTSFSDASGF